LRRQLDATGCQRHWVATRRSPGYNHLGHYDLFADTARFFGAQRGRFSGRNSRCRGRKALHLRAIPGARFPVGSCIAGTGCGAGRPRGGAGAQQRRGIGSSFRAYADRRRVGDAEHAAGCGRTRLDIRPLWRQDSTGRSRTSASGRKSRGHPGRFGLRRIPERGEDASPPEDGGRRKRLYRHQLHVWHHRSSERRDVHASRCVGERDRRSCGAPNWTSAVSIFGPCPCSTATAGVFPGR
jgi:hypothetical protein